jgi:hypothetical protein
MGTGTPWWKAPWPNRWLRFGVVGVMVFGLNVLSAIRDPEPGESFAVGVGLLCASLAATLVGVGLWLNRRRQV